MPPDPFPRPTGGHRTPPPIRTSPRPASSRRRRRGCAASALGDERYFACRYRRPHRLGLRRGGGLMSGFEKRASLTGDRGFESFFLQRGVRCEPGCRGQMPSMTVGVRQRRGLRRPRRVCWRWRCSGWSPHPALPRVHPLSKYRAAPAHSIAEDPLFPNHSGPRPGRCPHITGAGRGDRSFLGACAAVLL
jgi:hypothetical protein